MINIDVVNELFTIAKNVPKVSNARIASALVKKNSIVCYGSNKYKTHPIQKKFAKNSHAVCLHAEIDVIIKFLNGNDISDLKKHDLYIVRAKYDESGGKFVYGKSKPCEGCVKAIKHFGIKSVYYSEDNNCIDEL